jgi:hypothetical protein
MLASKYGSVLLLIAYRATEDLQGMFQRLSAGFSEGDLVVRALACQGAAPNITLKGQVSTNPVTTAPQYPRDVKPAPIRQYHPFFVCCFSCHSFNISSLAAVLS